MVADQGEEVLVVLVHERRLAELVPVHVVAVAGGLDVEVPVRCEPAAADVQLDVRPTRRPLVAQAEVREVSARRPRDVERAAGQARDLLRLAAVRVDRPHGIDLLQAVRLAAVGEEGDARAVGRPGGAADVVVGVRDAPGLGLVDVGDPHARVLVADADAVEAPRVVADRARGRVIGIADEEALLA